MLGRLVGKLLFKASVFLLLMAGVMTYGVYLKGGDAGELWEKVAAGAFGKAGDTFSRTKDDAVGLAENFVGRGAASDDQFGRAEKTEIFTWVDANGVTHFGSTAPSGVKSKTLSVDPNVNVVAPVATGRFKDDSDVMSVVSDTGLASQASLPGEPRTANSRSARSNQVDQSVRDLEAEMGEPLPGIAGKLLSGGTSNGNGMDPAQLIRLLQ